MTTEPVSEGCSEVDAEIDQCLFPNGEWCAPTFAVLHGEHASIIRCLRCTMNAREETS